MNTFRKIINGGSRALLAFMLVSIFTLQTFAAGSLVNGNTYSYRSSYDSEGGTGWHDFTVPGYDYHGLCIDPLTTAGRSGEAKVYKMSNNSDTAKVAYYYGIQRGLMDNKGAHGTFGQMISLRRMIQYTYRPDDIASELSPSDLENVKAGVRAALSVSVPDGFEIYRTVPTDGLQEFTLWRMEPTGKLNLKKASANPSITG